MLVAVGGVRFKGAWATAPFYLLAAPSLMQARRTVGCVFAETTTETGVVFSITGWDSPAAMKRYARAWPHRLAAWSTPYLTASDRFFHFYAAERPSLAEAISRWHSAA
ncbi:MAG: hypothetical protein AAGJ96_03935 [Pseudomonadota bacterium]